MTGDAGVAGIELEQLEDGGVDSDHVGGFGEVSAKDLEHTMAPLIIVKRVRKASLQKPSEIRVMSLVEPRYIPLRFDSQTLLCFSLI